MSYSGLLLLGGHKGSKPTLPGFVKWAIDGFSFFFFFNTTLGPISKGNICFNSGMTMEQNSVLGQELLGPSPMVWCPSGVSSALEHCLQRSSSPL